MRKFVLLSLSALTLIIILMLSWFIHLNRVISTRLSERQFAPPIDLYSAPEKIIKGQTFEKVFFIDILRRHKYRQREAIQVLREGDYSLLGSEACAEVLGDEIPDGTTSCLNMVTRKNSFGPSRDSIHQLVAMDENQLILEVFSGDPLDPRLFIELEPELFAQFYGNTPILRQITQLKDTPVLCLNALLAIEDSSFLEHRGFSVTGMARALLRNIRGGRLQGGSTITQQLVKNYFLTSERTLKRKLTEIAMALILEAHLNKDEILETYLNVIYMGQNGPFQVRGYGSASRHYFNKDLEDLNLSECALMAAIVNGPGIYNPFTQMEKAKTRRAKVLGRMHELKMISPEDEKAASAEDLPKKPPEILTETAPYFVDAVLNQLQTLKIETDKGLRVYTTLNRRAQQLATKSVARSLERIEKDFKKVKEQKEKKKNLLETCLISADPNSGFIQALVGGRGYKVSQFNRAISGHRQVGSIMKPLVYLAALENVTPEGNPYTPLTQVEDVKFTYKYEGQKWSPENYDKKYRGAIPMYRGLKDSLNAATASVGVAVGLNSVVDIARRLGIDSKLLPLPSITLGAFELYPIEVLRAYTTLARTGSKIDLSFIRTVEDLDANLIFINHYEEQLATAPENVAVLVGMMKQTLETGTARAARLWGFTHPAAGKTGTTSDTRDSWFAGFTPYHVAIVWLGYDNNEPHGLTGASGALPIWTDYMKSYASHFPPIDFPIPENTTRVKVPAPEQEVEEGKRDPNWPTEIELIFKTGTEPAASE